MAFGQHGIQRSRRNTIRALDDRRGLLHFQKQIFCLVIFSALLVLLLLVGCSKQPAVKNSQNRQIVDEAGNSISVPARIERVVSLAPNLTEIVFAIGAGDRLVGNTTYCDFPAEARRVEKVGDTRNPNIERILALRPQVVLISTASQLEAFTSQLAQHQIAIYVTDPRDLEGVFRSIKGIGDLLDKSPQTDQLLQSLRARTTAVSSAVSRARPIKVFYQLSAEPLYTAGRDAFVTDIIHRAGGASVTADVPGAWPRYTAESALAAEPEAIILPTGGSMGAVNATIAPALEKSPAARNGKILKINDDFLTRPGPRAVNGLEEMARALHPEAFLK